MKSLNDIKVGNKAVIKKLKGEKEINKRLLDIGFIEGTTVKCVGISPFGDPKAFLVRGAVIAMRSDDLKSIYILS